MSHPPAGPLTTNWTTSHVAVVHHKIYAYVLYIYIDLYIDYFVFVSEYIYEEYVYIHLYICMYTYSLNIYIYILTCLCTHLIFSFYNIYSEGQPYKVNIFDIPTVML